MLQLEAELSEGIHDSISFTKRLGSCVCVQKRTTDSTMSSFITQKRKGRHGDAVCDKSTLAAFRGFKRVSRNQVLLINPAHSIQSSLSVSISIKARVLAVCWSGAYRRVCVCVC